MPRSSTTRPAATVDEPDADHPADQPERLHAGRTHEERRLERRQALLATALELFGTKGYDHVSIAELCRVSHVTTRYFYEEFGSREELLLSLYDDLLVSTVSNLRALPPDAPAREGGHTRERVEVIIEALVGDPRVGRILFVEPNSLDSPLHTRQAAWASVFVDLVADRAEQLDPGGASREVWEVVGTGLVGAVTQILGQHVTREDPPPDEVVFEAIYRIFNAFGVATVFTMRPDDGRSVDSLRPQRAPAST